MSKSKYLDLAGLTVYDGKIKEWIKSSVIDITDEAINALFVTIAEGPADNEIWYTTVDGSLIRTQAPMDSEWAMMFGTPVVSNTYNNGKGVLLFENALTKLGNFSITGDNLQTIILPSKVNDIIQPSWEGAFLDCPNLASVTVVGSNSVYDSRNNCNAIIETDTNTLIIGGTDTIIPNSVISIGSEAFYGRTQLTFITIPNSVTTIGGSAFSDCSSLTSITIPDSVTYIGDNAFRNCRSLTSITIPNSVTSIGDYAFVDCNAMTSIVVEEGNTTYDSRENCNAIIETATNTLITGCQNTVIPNSVTSIGEWAFAHCSSLTSITIPNSVTSIESSAFSGCSGLTSITIPNRVTSIGSNAFRNCRSLTSITIPNSVTSIGDFAFYDCYGLTSVTIGNSVTSIGSNAFSHCTSLTSITIPNSVTNIGSSAFYDCTSLRSVTIPNSVTMIKMNAFYDCSGLNYITYEGTTKQWNSTPKGNNWNANVPATHVQCTDGQVTL
jgi:hypothetical protein